MYEGIAKLKQNNVDYYKSYELYTAKAHDIK